MVTRFLYGKLPENEIDGLTLQTGKVESLQKSCSRKSPLVNSPFAQPVDVSNSVGRLTLKFPNCVEPMIHRPLKRLTMQKDLDDRGQDSARLGGGLAGS
jgi:hypothetical protein